MKLQADPTVVYGASGGSGAPDHPLTKAELARDDPFNTYRSNGLPPAPICSPSVASLEAVAHPLSSDDLYFVADGTGGHVFSKGLEAHASAVAKWRALPCGSASEGIDHRHADQHGVQEHHRHPGDGPGYQRDHVCSGERRLRGRRRGCLGA